MLQQARDLLDEGIEFKALLDTLTAQDWETPTPFKSWTINQIVQHLHGSDKMAVLSLKGREGFESTVKDRKTLGSTMNPTQTGQQLLDDWWSYFQEMCELLGASDPQAPPSVVRARHGCDDVHHCQANGNLGPRPGYLRFEEAATKER